MRKRILALLLVLGLTAGFLPLSACEELNKKRGEGSQTEEQEMTRGEWVMELGDTFGLSGSDTETPYFSDVGPDNPLFDYVQAASDWGFLSSYSGSDTFNADEPISWEEMAAATAIAAGWSVTEDQFDENGVFDPSEAIEFALEQGIVVPPETEETEAVTVAQAKEAVSAAVFTYLSEPQGRQSVVFADGVVDLSNLPSGQMQIADAQISTPGTITYDSTGTATALIETGSGIVEVGEGGVIITAPTQIHPAGLAYKVDTIREENGTIVFDTIEPTLEDLYDELDVVETVHVNPSDIVWENGVSAVPTGNGDGEYQVILLSSNRRMRTTAMPLSSSYSTSHHFEFGNGKFEKNWSSENSALTGDAATALDNSSFSYNGTPSIDDFKGSTESWTENLQVENKFSGGYKITGDININALSVTTNVDYKKLLGVPYGVNKASVQLNSDITASLKMEGNLKEELKIATVPIPIATTGLSITIDLLLYANASGTLEVKAQLNTQAKAEYVSGSGIRATKEASAQATADASIELNCGAKFAVSLDALGVVKIMDASIEAGADLTASAHIGGDCTVSEADGVTTLNYQESMNIKADIYAPIITISVGNSDTLLGKLGLSKSWNLMTRENCFFHKELLNKEWVFWEETITINADGEILSQEEQFIDEEQNTNTAGDEVAVTPGKLDIDVYYCALSVGQSSTISVSRLPQGFSLSDVTWATSDANIATVSGGVVTGVSAGVTTITATLDGTTVSCTISVS